LWWEYLSDVCLREGGGSERDTASRTELMGLSLRVEQRHAPASTVPFQGIGHIGSLVMLVVPPKQVNIDSES
jgi:hypothetical protein